jgi:hypothetical protein
LSRWENNWKLSQENNVENELGGGIVIETEDPNVTEFLAQDGDVDMFRLWAGDSVELTYTPVLGRLDALLYGLGLARAVSPKVLATVSVLGIERVKGAPNALVGLAMKEGAGEPVVRRLEDTPTIEQALQDILDDYFGVGKFTLEGGKLTRHVTHLSDPAAPPRRKNGCIHGSNSDDCPDCRH